MDIIVYQTLKDNSNPDEVEQFGPFPCRRPDAWLGYGYYFWDTFIDLAHWWGNTCPDYHGKYIVCEAAVFKDDSCWDLHGNGAHLQEFEYICYEIIDSGISATDKLLVPEVIEFLKRKGIFKYKAIRALGVDSVTNWSKVPVELLKVRFKAGLKSYLDLRPPVQICLIEKKALYLRGFRIVYPDDYVEEYA
jgi:hypothetical protein